MMEERSITLSQPQLAADRLGFFRWGRIAGKVLVTTDGGDWAFLTDQEFNELLAGRVVDGHPRFQELQSKGVLRDGLDLDAMAEKVARRNQHVSRGPHLHIVILTLRCNQTCAYCQVSRETVDTAGVDMSPETAEQVVDLALQSPSPSITFEFQGGEPLLNFDVLRHVVECARSRAERAGKTLSFSLVSNFTAMTEERAEWLIGNDVLVCTSLDGPASVHDANRKWKHGSAYAEVVRWIDYFNRRYVELGRDPRLWHIDALMTTTRQTLGAWREVIDEYVTRGMPTIHLRPLNPSGFARDTWQTIGYTAEEYLNFYRQALDYILELNRHGVELIERTASIFLMKILTSEDPGFVDIQSPCGAGTGQVAYNFDGRVFPCDEARMVDAMGDALFELGHVRDLTIPDMLRHPTVRAIASASLLDAQPMCAECWNKPFCGVCPVYNFVSQQSLFGQRPRSFKCKEHMAISGRLFELLANAGDVETTEILKRWTITRPRLAGDGRALKEAP
jgi:uncharacterized protein